jgi:MOSC domain-containing protein YiiM
MAYHGAECQMIVARFGLSGSILFKSSDESKGNQNMMQKVMSISVGKSVPLFDKGSSQQEKVLSAIHKSSVSTLDEPLAVALSLEGFEGDEQADREVHGGRDKAVYAYPSEHYDFWQDLLKREIKRKELLRWGSFGENLTIMGLTEEEVWVGDVWMIGEVELRVVKLREPCFKFNAKMNYKGASQAMIQSATSGWYLRVIKPGVMSAGEDIKVYPGPRKLNIKAQNQLLWEQRSGAASLF